VGFNKSTKKVKTGYRPRKLQHALHLLLTGLRFLVLVCHRRFGKTVLVVNEIIDQAMRNPLRNPQYAYIAPTYRQAKRIAWQYFVDYTRNLPGVQCNKTELTVYINRPHRRCPMTGDKEPDVIKIMLIGSDDPDDIRGVYLDGAALDEFAQQDPIVWGQIVRPALADRKKIAAEMGFNIEPWAIFLGTPKGQNHFHRRYKKAQEYERLVLEYSKNRDIILEREDWKEFENGPDLPENDLKAILRKLPAKLVEMYAMWRKYKVASNWATRMFKASETGILDQEELDEMREDLTPEEVEQELECSFTAAILGSYFGKLINDARSEERIGEVPYNPRFPVDTHWDLGVGDKCVIWFRQKINGMYHYIDYYEYNGEGVEFYIKVLDAKAGVVGSRIAIDDGTFMDGHGYKYGRHVWPNDGSVQEFGTGVSRQETARTLGLIVELQVKQRVEDRIQASRNRIKISRFDQKKCERGVECLYNYQKEWDDKLMMFKNKPKHDWSSHGTDGFGYSSLDDRDSKFAWEREKHLQTQADGDYNEFLTAR